ncbi:GNAT family N-acetyltransferase [Taibaiella sp. KBW10]|uniref:GNAT family N-acetyltransferase n=1 Tax=Taibaiella sp. KBW10 TaxID=2153357 RepID=UPI000F59A656|nr:GNAT family N-acetyltransferase [Taibaiella sp. KBW10]RQO30095.1 GNAT family N-acetyltransferase [Taibaiella sp. KBW10]
MSLAPIEIIRSQHPDYLKVLSLRQAVLRAPLGLNLYDEDLSREIDEHIFIYKDGTDIVGCLLLAPNDVQKGKLRQMAIAPAYQGKGIGAALLAFAETFARQKNYTMFTLHARNPVRAFYEKSGYEPQGDIFEEVGIPHIKMIKYL